MSIMDILKQAKDMQSNLKKVQKDLERSEVIGESGAGMVKITMSGDSQVKKIHIDDSLFNDDRDMIEDLIASAINDAVRRVEKLKQEKMSALSEGISLPAGMKLPF